MCARVRLYLHIWLRNIHVSTYYHGINIRGSRLPECPMTHLLMRTVNFLLTHIAGPSFTSEEVYIIVGCKTHLKIRDTGRGTTTFAKEGIDLTRVTHLPSRCGIAAVYAGVGTVNLHAPSGTSQRQARENFYTEVPYIFRPSWPWVRISIVFCPRRTYQDSGILVGPWTCGTSP